MPIVRYGEPLNVLVAAKGHPYKRDPFMEIFDALPGIACSLVEQPLAARLMTPEGLAGVDVVVLYDMPGLDFRGPSPPAEVAPDEGFKAAFLDLLEEGRVGVVALHHAIAGWPAWPEYAQLLGGRFLYRPARLRGQACADSGYRHEVKHQVSVLDPAHPIAAGVPASFTLTDEVYLFEVFEDLVRPLLGSDYGFTQENFYSSALAVAGEMFSNNGWSHPPGSNLVGWTKRARNAPLVYLQPGDGPETYADPTYRRLIENAIRWAASPEARAAVPSLPG